MKITSEQKKALFKVWCRDEAFRREHKFSYLAYRRTVQPGYGCLMLPWCGMWLGIETDGYTHS